MTYLQGELELMTHVLRGRRYVAAARSEIVPKLDPALITRFMTGGTQTQAVRALRRELRSRATKR